MKDIRFLLKKIYKIALISNDNKRIQYIYLIEIYGYGTSKDLLSEKEKIKCNNMIKGYQNDWHWQCYERNIKEHNSN